MRFSSILFFLAIFTNVAKSGIIKCKNKSNSFDQLAFGNEVEFKKRIKYKNFRYNFYCLEDFDNMCYEIKNNLNDALDIISSTFGKLIIYFNFFFFITILIIIIIIVIIIIVIIIIIIIIVIIIIVIIIIIIIIIVIIIILI